MMPTHQVALKSDYYDFSRFESIAGIFQVAGIITFDLTPVYLFYWIVRTYLQSYFYYFIFCCRCWRVVSNFVSLSLATWVADEQHLNLGGHSMIHMLGIKVYHHTDLLMASKEVYLLKSICESCFETQPNDFKQHPNFRLADNYLLFNFDFRRSFHTFPQMISFMANYRSNDLDYQYRYSF